MTGHRSPNALSYLALLSLAAALAGGCGTDPEDDLTPHGPAVADEGGAPDAPNPGPQAEGPSGEADPATILRSVIQLIRDAPNNPGGANFDNAKDQLNHFFAGSSPRDFQLPEASRAYLLDRFGPEGSQRVATLEEPVFTVRDARHIEDSALLHAVAVRVAGDGDDLTRARRLFDWLVRQVELVPPGSLAPPGGQVPHAQARPYDVITRGMATEAGPWAERSWIFMALCRQLNLDSGLILHDPPAKPRGPVADGAEAGAEPPAEASVWGVAVLIDGVPHVFDARIGMPVPGPGGEGVATIEQAATDPAILAALELPGRPYSTTQADLAAGKLTVWIDSTLGQLSPRMRQLQLNLAGRDRMVLFRDPAEQDAAWKQALGDRLGKTDLWPMPVRIEDLLFTDPNFNRSTQFAGFYFNAALPLLPARLAQLRGELKESVESYAGFRFAQNPLANNGRDAIPPAVQQVLDLYATYMLGLAKLDQGDSEAAERFFRQTLTMFPEPQPGGPYVFLFRHGAETNLGRLAAERGRGAEAVRYLTRPQPTPQEHGNLLQARALLWDDPFAPEAAPAATTAAAGEPR